MTCQEAWKIVLGAVENTYEDNVKEALFLLAEAAARQDELNELSKMSLDHADVSGLNNPFFGKHHSEETCEQLRLINKGKIMSEESRKKISMAMSGENHPLYGTHCSEERKRKISESNKGVLLGVKFTEDHKKKLSESVRQSWNNRPRTFSEETRRKMSEAQLKRHRKEVI